MNIREALLKAKEIGGVAKRDVYLLEPSIEGLTFYVRDGEITDLYYEASGIMDFDTLIASDWSAVPMPEGLKFYPKQFLLVRRNEEAEEIRVGIEREDFTKAQMNVSTTFNGGTHTHVYINAHQSNELQNKVMREIEARREPQSNIHKGVVLYWYQARGGDVHSTAGDKGVIESIASKPVKVHFTDESLKHEMVLSEENPFRHAYVVDVAVETIENSPILYRVVALHDKLERRTMPGGYKTRLCRLLPIVECPSVCYVSLERTCKLRRLC